MSVNTYRVDYSFDRSNLQQLKEIQNQGHLQFFDDGRVGYIDPKTKTTLYLNQAASEVGFDSSGYVSGLRDVSATLQGLADYLDQYGANNMSVGPFDGNLSESNTLQDALDYLDDFTAPPPASPGSDSELLFNNSGAIDSIPEITWDGSQLTVAGILSAAAGSFTGNISGDSLNVTNDISAINGDFTGTVTASIFNGIGISLSGNISAISIYADSISLSGNLTMDGIARIRATDPATSSTTGALQVDGGISVDEASWFGDDILLEGGNLTLDHGGLVDAVINLHGSTEFLIRATPTDTFQIRDKTANSNRMTIDGTGNTVFSGTISDSDGNVRDNIDLEFINAYNTYYTEYTYTSGDLTQVDIWETSGKTTKLFTKVLAYTSGNLTSVALTDEVNSNTLTKTLTYDVDGNLETLTRTYS